MKHNIFAALTIAAIALVGLPSCTTTSNSVATTPASAEDQQQSQTIKATGGSSTIGVLRILMNAYTLKTKSTQATFFPPSQTESTLAGVKDGLVDIGSLSRQLKPKENSGTLEQLAIAKDGLLVATHPGIKDVTNLTIADLRAIYSGTATNWKEFGGPNAKIVVLDRPEDESAKRLLREHYLGKDLKNAPEAVVFRKQDELISALQSTPYSIGAFSLGDAISGNLPVNRLSLDGIEPTLDNIQSGKYKMIRLIVLIFKKSPSAATQAFIDFVSGAESTDLLRQSGFLPTTPTNGKS